MPKLTFLTLLCYKDEGSTTNYKSEKNGEPERRRVRSGTSHPKRFRTEPS